MPTIRHTVDFRLNFAPGSAEEASFLDAGRELAAIPGVQDFQVFRQVGTKNDFTFGFAMDFADQATYDAYNNHPDHVAFVANNWVPNVAAFLEADYVVLPAS